MIINDTVEVSPKGALVQQEIIFRQQAIPTLVTLVVRKLSSTVDRIDYGNDTATIAAKGNLNTAKYRRGNGNANFGYFGGGNLSANVERVDYLMILQLHQLREI